MNMRKQYTFKILTLLALSVLLFTGCNKRLKPASVIVVNPVLHLYPIPQGELQKILFEIENTSDNPLFIQEIQTTCGCIVPRNELPIVILPHKLGTIHLAYNTIKNTGYVDHFVYCYGNFEGSDCLELSSTRTSFPEPTIFVIMSNFSPKNRMVSTRFRACLTRNVTNIDQKVENQELIAC